jgi:DNA modification methylase
VEVNSIYEGDNLEIMNKFPEKSIDLIYADPPFYTNKRFEIIWNDGAEKRAFEDRWAGGIEHYIAWMEPRIHECHRLLKDGGSFYLHCDDHAAAHLRILLDKVFGEKNFINDIIWFRQSGAHSDAKQGSTHFGRAHDNILFYSKGEPKSWNPQYEPYDESYLKNFYKYVEPETGRRYRLDNLTGPGGAAKGNPYYEVMGIKRYWRYSEEKMKQLIKEGRIIKTNPKAVPSYKRYLDEGKGVPIMDVWTDIAPIQSQSNERLGYPTQKPVALLERIINTSSDKGDIVLDPFCGCGTTLIAAQKLGRKWIGIDISPTACKLMKKRLQKEFGVNAMLVRGQVDLNYVKKLSPFEFQNWVIAEKFLGKVSDRKVGDMGIDGFTPQVLGGHPIQVKQSEGIGRNVIDNFETAMRRIRKKKGYIVAFSFGKGAIEEVARIKNAGELDIILRTVQDLLEGTVE